MTYYVYLLKTQKDTLYCGIAKDVNKRFEEHLSGANKGCKGAKYTNANKPVEIVYKALYETKSEAMKEEYRIKKLTRLKKLEMIEEYNSANRALF